MFQSWKDPETTLTHLLHHGAASPKAVTKRLRVGGAGPSCLWLHVPGSPCCEHRPASHQALNVSTLSFPCWNSLKAQSPEKEGGSQTAGRLDSEPTPALTIQSGETIVLAASDKPTPHEEWLSAATSAAPASLSGV